MLCSYPPQLNINQTLLTRSKSCPLPLDFTQRPVPQPSQATPEPFTTDTVFPDIPPLLTKCRTRGKKWVTFETHPLFPKGLPYTGPVVGRGGCGLVKAINFSTYQYVVKKVECWGNADSPTYRSAQLESGIGQAIKADQLKGIEGAEHCLGVLTAFYDPYGMFHAMPDDGSSHPVKTNVRGFKVSMIQERVTGGSLEDIANTDILRSNPYEMKRVMKEILKGVEYLHKKAVAHNDIKPANILLTQEGTVKIIDFGLAGINGAYGRPLGTPGYVHPKQYTANRHSISSDMFSVGVTFLDLLIPDFHVQLQRHVEPYIRIYGINYAYQYLNQDADRYRLFLNDLINNQLPPAHADMKSLLRYLILDSLNTPTAKVSGKQDNVSTKKPKKLYNRVLTP